MIKGKTLTIALLVLAVLAIGLGIVQLWFTPMLMETFIKALGTLLIIGIVTSLLIAIDYNLPRHKVRILLGVIAALILAGGLILILQIWWQVFSGALFWKLAVTFVVLSIFLGFILAMLEDFGPNKELRSKKYID